MKTCDACGKPLKGGLGIGSALLCRTCAPDVQAKIDEIKAEGKAVNTMGIARQMFRETHSAGNYLLRDIPMDLMDQIRDKAHEQGVSMREWMLGAFRQALK